MLHASPAARIVAESDPRAFVRPQPPESAAAPTSLAFAFHTAQENLAALQRLAEQTADLHRQFLEGQEKTQQTFLKLLEHQQRLSQSSPEPAALSPSGQIAPRDSLAPGLECGSAQKIRPNPREVARRHASRTRNQLEQTPPRIPEGRARYKGFRRNCRAGQWRRPHQTGRPGKVSLRSSGASPVRH